MTDTEFYELRDTFESMYKYYKGWVYEFAHPGVFVYHQMGGPLSIYFTPDHDEPGVVSIQQQNNEGETIDSKSVRYGDGKEAIEPYRLFEIVRPWLERFNTW